MKAVGRPQKWTKMCRSGRKSVGARYEVISNLFEAGLQRLFLSIDDFEQKIRHEINE